MRYFVECTHTRTSALNTGIQRVVRNLVNHSLDGAAGEREVVPVVFGDGAFHALPERLALPPAETTPAAGAPAADAGGRDSPVLATKIYLRNVYVAARSLACALLPLPPLLRFLSAPRTQWGLTKLLLLPRTLLRKALSPPALRVQAGDVLVLLDSSWHLDLWPAVHAARARGAKVVCVIYDLIPYTDPEFCDPPLVDAFNRWMKIALREADAFVCISRTIADSLQDIVPRVAPERRGPLRCGHFWLGSELESGTQHDTGTPTEVAALIAADAPLYLYVSTIEPRKNHAYALDAFEALWADKTQARLVIVGRIGWRCEALLERIRNHPESGRRLFMFNGVDDATLAALYDRANGLVFSSRVEGFGLPLVEALQRGLPVFASDIPVFREIAQAGVHFVDLATPGSLQSAIADHIRNGAQRLEAPVPWLHWRESTTQFWDRLDATLAQ